MFTLPGVGFPLDRVFVAVFECWTVNLKEKKMIESTCKKRSKYFAVGIHWEHRDNSHSVGAGDTYCHNSILVVCDKRKEMALYTRLD